MREWKAAEMERRKRSKTLAASSRDEIRERLEYSYVDGERTLSVKECVKQQVLPFVPCHKDVARRLVNMLFMDEERINRNVTGRRNPPMDRERMGAIKRAVFSMCPTGGEAVEKVWSRCVSAIDTQNRNLKRLQI